MSRTLSCLVAIVALAGVGCGADDASDGAADTPPGASTPDATHDADAQPADAKSERDEVRSTLSKLTGNDETDRDGDGIDDVDEELLLRHYRPWMKFSKDGSGKDESHRPSDPLAVIRNAQLEEFKGDGNGTTDPLSGCGRPTDHHMDPPEQILTCRKDASFLTNFAKTSYAVDVLDSDYAGPSLADYEKNAHGFFGHVVPDTVSGHPAYKIEYWQYYAYNNQDIGIAGARQFGDHEGDWTGIQLWFDRTAGRIVQVLYMIHGKKAWFHYTPEMAKTACTKCFVTVKGPKWNTSPGNFFDDNERAQYDDNQSELWIDADGYKHVVVYVENGGHESWPGAWGHADIDVGPFTVAHPNPHKGDGTTMLAPLPPDRPLNAGEVEKPLTPYYGTILQFNGYWGSTNADDLGIRVRKSPPGPASHCEWKSPTKGPLAHCEN